MLSFTTRPRPCITAPSAITASTPRQRSRAFPYRSTFTPPALVPSRPPTRADPSDARVSGKIRPASSAAAWTSASTHPASATSTPSTRSRSRIRFIRSKERTTGSGPSTATCPPTRPVPPE